MLLAIYPVAALHARRRRRGSDAELVSAAIERVRTAHRYVYEWDLGPTSDLVTPDRAMAILKAAPDLIFPFGVSGGTCIELNRVLDLDDVRWPRDNGNPVLVSHTDSTSFTFLTLPGHFRGPGRTIQFTILGRDGRLILRHVGATHSASPRWHTTAGHGSHGAPRQPRSEPPFSGGAHALDLDRIWPERSRSGHHSRGAAPEACGFTDDTEVCVALGMGVAGRRGDHRHVRGAGVGGLDGRL